MNNGSVFLLAAGSGDIDTSAIEEPAQWSLLLAVPLGVALLYGMVQLIRTYLPELPLWKDINDEEE